MDKKESFKLFVKNHPKLLDYVKTGTSTWQNFYEIYDIYGEDENIWKKYLVTDVVAGTGIASIFEFLKSIDLDELQNGVNNVGKVIGMLGDITKKDNTNTTYKPRPIYRKFDD